MSEFNPGRVYFLTDGEAIKIGYSGAPNLRLRDLQGAHHRELRLLAWITGTVENERAIHRQFAHLNVRGEWFRPEPDLVAFVKEIETQSARNEQMRRLRILQKEVEDWVGRQSQSLARAYGLSLSICLSHMIRCGNPDELRNELRIAVTGLGKAKAMGAATGRPKAA